MSTCHLAQWRATQYPLRVRQQLHSGNFRVANNRLSGGVEEARKARSAMRLEEHTQNTVALACCSAIRSTIGMIDRYCVLSVHCVLPIRREDREVRAVIPNGRTRARPQHAGNTRRRGHCKGIRNTRPTQHRRRASDDPQHAGNTRHRGHCKGIRNTRPTHHPHRTTDGPQHAGNTARSDRAGQFWNTQPTQDCGCRVAPGRTHKQHIPIPRRVLRPRVGGTLPSNTAGLRIRRHPRRAQP